MIGTTIAICDQCKKMKECIADILTCRYICLNCHEFNTTKDVRRFYDRYRTNKRNTFKDASTD